MLLKETIKQYVRDVLKENAERAAIREMVKNELRRMYNEGVFESGKEEDDGSEDKGATETAVGQLKNILDNNPMIKKSQVAYKVLPGVPHDSARHIFNDMLDPEEDDEMTTQDANVAIDAIHNAGI